MCDDKTKTIFDSNECYKDPKMFHEYSAAITVGYLTFDFIFSAFILQDFTALGLQTIFHHLTAALGYTLAMIMNNPGIYLMLAVGNQHTEVSAPFMHIR